MGENRQLVKLDVLGELSKPATLLIEKISNAITGFARPWQIRRVRRLKLMRRS